MEILALLLLGLLAMLAIVPPIIRGKIEESPLATAQSFQRSMEEIAHSIESGSRRSARAYAGEVVGRGAGPSDVGHASTASSVARRRRTSAAARRNRVTAALSLFAFTWGIAALLSGKAWCLVLFAVFTVLLISFWLLSIIVPYMAAPARTARAGGKGARGFPSRYPDRRAM